MNKKYIVTLEPAEREDLERLVRTGQAAASKIRHANVLLAADTHGPNWTDAQLAQGFSLSERGVAELRKRFVEQGLEVALGRKPRETPSVAAMFDGEKEAKLVALACSEAPPRPGTLEPAAPGRQSRGTEDRGKDQPRDRAAGA